MRPVEGPRGPHLFRSSGGSSVSEEFQHALSLSPITPKAPSVPAQELDFCLSFEQMRALPAFDAPDYRFTDAPLDPARLASWHPEQVAQWMLDAGVELSVADKFVENDINGSIIVTLKFEDLRELDIPSFGIRSRLWDLIHVLRGSQPTPPEESTDIEDHPSREVRKEGKKDKHGDNDDCSRARRQRSKSKRDRHHGSHEDLISPMESVSIVGIEQLMPKPHSCSKGENCSKYRKYQRLRAEFIKEHPFADVDAGVILIAGNPGNPKTAEALLHSSPTKLQAPAMGEEARPVSDAIPSVVASSDVLGPGGDKSPWQYLQEATLRQVEKRDPQDNVKQFIEIQHQHVLASNDVPPTPPFELYPSQTPQRSLSRASLPRLSIPNSHSSNSNRPSKPHPLSQQPFVPYRMDKAEALSPELQSPPQASFAVSKTPYRFGTPFSDMDVPVTAVPTGPIARETSQSVPPDMNYRSPVHAIPVRTASRMGRHMSVSVLPPVKENVVSPDVTSPAAANPDGRRPSLPTDVQSERPQWPLRDAAVAAPSSSAAAASAMLAPARKSVDDDDVTFQGPMRKRRTRMLRHEWHEGYFTLRGTRLAMHRDAEAAQSRNTLEYVDIDDYAIACSGAASTGRLNAAFKAVNIALGKDSRGSGGGKHGLDPGAFSFQLVPQDRRGEHGFGRLRKRDSTMPAAAPAAAGPDAGVNTTGKAHHFAVKGRDERIEWMRELMLAKALRQKGGEGFAINVNGNMI